LKANFFGPVSATGPITTVFVNDTTPNRKYTAVGDFATGDITETWNDTF
jgi:hypothetical protein